MSGEICKNCKYFWQHYVLDTRCILRVYCGHCTKTKVRPKRPDAAACEKFMPAPSDEDAFIRKEYLSKELLRYVCGLDVLPEIKDLKEE